MLYVPKITVSIRQSGKNCSEKKLKKLKRLLFVKRLNILLLSFTSMDRDLGRGGRNVDSFTKNDDYLVDYAGILIIGHFSQKGKMFLLICRPGKGFLGRSEIRNRSITFRRF